MISGGTIIETGAEISEDDQRELESILRYFDYSHGFSDLKYLPADFTGNDTEKYFGFSYISYRRSINQEIHYFDYYFKDLTKLIVRDYDYLYCFSDYNDEVRDAENNLKIKFNKFTMEFKILYNETEIYRKSLLPVLAEFHKENKGLSYEDYYEKEFTFTDENDNTSLKIIFKYFSGNYEKENPDDLNIRSISFIALIRLKN
jgi:hypothetical protein